MKPCALLLPPPIPGPRGMERAVLKIAERFDARICCACYGSEGAFPEFAGLDMGAGGRLPINRLPFGKRVAMSIAAGWTGQAEPKRQNRHRSFLWQNAP